MSKVWSIPFKLLFKLVMTSGALVSRVPNILRLKRGFPILMSMIHLLILMILVFIEVLLVMSHHIFLFLQIYLRILCLQTWFFSVHMVFIHEVDHFYHPLIWWIFDYFWSWIHGFLLTTIRVLFIKRCFSSPSLILWWGIFFHSCVIYFGFYRIWLLISSYP